MKPTTLALLVAVTAAVLAAGLWLNRDAEPTTADSDYLVPQLTEQLNMVSAIHIATAQSQPAVSIVRGADSWVVAQQDNFPADASKVRKLLLALAEAQVIEPKTANPEYYPRIGVQSLNNGGAQQISVEGVNAPAIIIGNSEASRNAFYARRDGEQQSWLVRGTLDAPTDPELWLARQIIDIPAARVAVISVSHADGDVLSIRKQAFGQQLELVNMPEGAELERSNILDPIGGVLADLRLDAVHPAAGFDWPADATRFVLTTFDGLQIAVDAASRDEQYFVKLSAAPDSDTVNAYQAEAADTDASGADEATSPDMSAAEEEARRLTKRLQGWVFEIPKYKFDQLTRRTEDVLSSG